MRMNKTLKSKIKHLSGRKWTISKLKKVLNIIWHGSIVLKSNSLPYGKNTHVVVLCAQCHHIWHPTVESLACGYGCPKCASKHAGMIKSKTGIKHVRHWYHNQSAIHFLHPKDLLHYKNLHSRIACVCTKCGYGSHGEWTPQYMNLITSTVCPRCNHNLSLTKSSLSKLVQQKFHGNIRIIKFPNILSDINSVKLKCMKHDFIYRTKIENIKYGSGNCPLCTHSLTMTIKLARKILNKKSHNTIYLRNNKLANYEHSIVYPICLKCGYGKHREWHLRLNSLLEKPKCPNCTGRFQKIPKSIIIRRINKIFNNTIKVTFNNNKFCGNDRCNATCKIHNYTWHPLIFNLLNGCGCVLCGREKTLHVTRLKGKISFMNWYFNQNYLIIPHFNKYLKLYKNDKQYVMCICNKRHDKWFARIGQLIQGCGCPFCDKSRGERIINYDLYSLYNLTKVATKKELYSKNNSFKHSYLLYDKYGRLSIDFMVHYHHKYYGIEFDGCQHFIPVDFSYKLKHYKKVKNYKAVKDITNYDNKKLTKQNNHDSRKTQWCKKNHIKLIRIKNKHIYLSYKKLKKLIRKSLDKYFIN